MAKGLYKFHWDCGRMGEVSGAFVAEAEAVAAALGAEIYLGEVLGKHSEIYGTLDPEDITLVTEDPAALEALGEFSVGINPLVYLEEQA